MFHKYLYLFIHSPYHINIHKCDVSYDIVYSYNFREKHDEVMIIIIRYISIYNKQKVLKYYK